MLLVTIVGLLGLIAEGHLQQHSRRQQTRLQLKAALDLKNRIKQRFDLVRMWNTQSICYDEVGCFSLPHKNSPLQKMPEDPRILDTKFYLYTRRTDSAKPEILVYDDKGKSLNGSTFDARKPLKVLVHGYTSKWNEKGAMIVMKTYLKLYDCNVILVDWHIGARPPQYAVAAANTELVGRQLGILLTHMVRLGSDARRMHLIGFSLGAHVCGTASESLKRQGYLLGRITGLDPASPLFRNNYLRETHKKLDRSDAKLVDVIHTDSSPFLTDGFGLYEPVGHVDFYPNGGQDQPGCNDVVDSVVVSHFERGLSKELVCSHVRAFLLFRESLQNLLERRSNGDACEFVAYNCAGQMAAFERGECFPQIRNGSAVKYGNDIGRIGEDVRGEGVMFLSTRGDSPFCGTQLQVIMELSHNCGPLKGILQIQLSNKNHTNFTPAIIQIQFRKTDVPRTMYGLASTNYKTIPENMTKMQAKFSYFNSAIKSNQTDEIEKPVINFDKITVRDMFGNNWLYCQKNTQILDSNGQIYDLLTISLTKNSCS